MTDSHAKSEEHSRHTDSGCHQHGVVADGLPEHATGAAQQHRHQRHERGASALGLPQCPQRYHCVNPEARKYGSTEVRKHGSTEARKHGSTEARKSLCIYRSAEALP